MYDELLQNIGLSDKESKVYLALLGLDTSSVNDIASKTDIKRPTAYVILQSLKDKGLVSELNSGRKVKYRVESPEHLETYIERRILNLKEKSQILKSAIPELKSLHKESGDRPVVRFYEGREGVLSAVEDVFTEDKGDNGDPFAYMVYPKDLVDKYFPDEVRKDVKKRRKSQDVKARILYTSKSKDLPTSDGISERIKIDSEEYPILADITVHQNGVWITVLGKRVAAIVIESKEVARTMKSILKLAFERVKNLKK